MQIYVVMADDYEDAFLVKAFKNEKKANDFADLCNEYGDKLPLLLDYEDDEYGKEIKLWEIKHPAFGMIENLRKDYSFKVRQASLEE